MITARFALYDNDGATVDEDALRADLTRAETLLASPVRTEGGLTVTDTDTGAWAGLGDTLAVLVGRFCGEGLDALVRDGKAEVDFLDHEETLTITVADERVRFDSTRFGQRDFPLAPYVSAMRECGVRYQALMVALEGEVPPPATE